MRLEVDWVSCNGHGLCAELLPELIDLDEWGYPVLRSTEVTGQLRPHARAAVAMCPASALRLRGG